MLNLGLGSIVVIIVCLCAIICLLWIIKKEWRDKGIVAALAFFILAFIVLGTNLVMEDNAKRIKKSNLFHNLETKRVITIDREKLLRKNIDDKEVEDLTINLYESKDTTDITMSKTEKQKIVITVNSGQDSGVYVIDYYFIQQIIDAGALKFKD